MKQLAKLFDKARQINLVITYSSIKSIEQKIYTLDCNLLTWAARKFQQHMHGKKNVDSSHNIQQLISIIIELLLNY